MHLKRQHGSTVVWMGAQHAEAYEGQAMDDDELDINIPMRAGRGCWKRCRPIWNVARRKGEQKRVCRQQWGMYRMQSITPIVYINPTYSLRNKFLESKYGAGNLHKLPAPNPTAAQPTCQSETTSRIPTQTGTFVHGMRGPNDDSGDDTHP